MSQQLLPGASDPDHPKLGNGADEGEDCERAHAGCNQRPKGSDIFSEEKCLSALSRLPGLIAMGYLTTAQANAIRQTLTAILQHHGKNRGREDQQTLKDPDVLAALRDHPELVNSFAAFMTDDQIDALMMATKDGGDGEA